MVNLISPPLNHTIKSEVCFSFPLTIKTQKHLLLYRPPNYTIFSVLLILYFCEVPRLSLQFSEMVHSWSQIGEVRTDMKAICFKNKFLPRSPKAGVHLHFSLHAISNTSSIATLHRCITMYRYVTVSEANNRFLAKARWPELTAEASHCANLCAFITPELLWCACICLKQVHKPSGEIKATDQSSSK